MQKVTPFILKKYSQMPGDKKIRLAMNLSKMARDVRKAGIKDTGA